MLCPVCKVDLLLSEKQGIEIDYCPKCRGIWLDRGELDKIVEKSANAEDNFRLKERNTNTNYREMMMISTNHMDIIRIKENPFLAICLIFNPTHC